MVVNYQRLLLRGLTNYLPASISRDWSFSSLSLLVSHQRVFTTTSRRPRVIRTQRKMPPVAPGSRRELLGVLWPILPFLVTPFWDNWMIMIVIVCDMLLNFITIFSMIIMWPICPLDLGILDLTRPIFKESLSSGHQLCGVANLKRTASPLFSTATEPWNGDQGIHILRQTMT